MAQKNARSDRFKQEHAWSDPLHIAPRLSGNFGELRGNHFHTGLDFKTEGREGLVVVAATDGRIARVKMSPWGYGNALYLEGPAGITTVYAHLQRFEPRIQRWAVERTYAGRSLGLDARPPLSAGLEFRAGDTLGWSGNSGSSGGPHLHFEIRNTANQHPLNPLDGWVAKTDSRPPVLPALWLETTEAMRTWTWTAGDTLRVPPKVRFSVEGYDLLDGAPNVCGLRTLEAEATRGNGGLALRYSASWAELDFGVNKDMNAHALYPIWQSQRDQVHRLHRLPTNRLAIYGTPADDGWIRLEIGEVASLRVRATDAAGNETVREVTLVGDPSAASSGWTPVELDWTDRTVEALPTEAGEWSNERVSLSWPEGTFFEPTSVGWTAKSDEMGGTLHPQTVPYRKPMHVSWAMMASAASWQAGWSVLPEDAASADNWVAVLRDEKGEVDATAKAVIEHGRVELDLTRGGEWSLELDTVPPRVLPYYSGTPIVSNGNAVWYVEDTLSGLDDLELRVNGEWARLVWDPKRNMATYEASDGMHPLGEPVELVLKATDEVGNDAVWSGTILWP